MTPDQANMKDGRRHERKRESGQPERKKKKREKPKKENAKTQRYKDTKTQEMRSTKNGVIKNMRAAIKLMNHGREKKKKLK